MPLLWRVGAVNTEGTLACLYEKEGASTMSVMGMFRGQAEAADTDE
jgi:hypothetical protein